jgi:pilus assembly protein CpaC
MILNTLPDRPDRPDRKERSRMPLKFASTLLLSAILGFGQMLPAATSASASDLQVQEEAGDFVRIGLNKSVVIRLPGNARDVVVGNADVVDAVVRSKNVAYLFGKQVGQSNVFFFDANGEQILALDLEVALDTKAIKKLINRTIPGNHIEVDTVGTNIVLGGKASAGEAKIAQDLASRFAGKGNESSQVINTIAIDGEDQVMLKVKVVEIQRDVLKQFGIDVQAILKLGQNVFNLASVNPFSNGLLSPDGGVSASDGIGSTRFDSVIRAMEGDGMLRLLAEPNLTAISGQEAKFHAGGEFPFQSCSFNNGNRECDVRFREFGVGLQFTPTVFSDGRINLKIGTEVSELSTVASGVSSIPSLNNRKAETTLELPSGGSMMIAGLIKESTRQNINGTPGLRKLPILGNLFRSRDYINNETELVVIVTPYIVKPMATNALTTPDKNFNVATDRQTFFFGRLNKTYGASGKAPSGSYHGNVGHIVE